MLVLARIASADDKADQALAAWAAACPTSGDNGVCATATAPPHHRVGDPVTICQPDARQIVVAVPRDARKARAATAALEAAAGANPELAVRARLAIALADAGLEALLADALPDLDFDPARPNVASASKTRLAAWIAHREAADGDAIAKYRDVIALRDPAGEVAALERIARVTESFTGALLASPIPAKVRANEDSTDAYCDTLVSAATEATVVEAFEICLARAVSLSWFDDSARSCERALGFYRPDHYPPAVELRGAPTASGPIPDLEP